MVVRRALVRACTPVVLALVLPSLARADGFFFTEFFERHDPFQSNQQITASSPTPTLSASPIRASVTSTGEVLGSGTRTITVTAAPQRSDTFWEKTLGDFEAAYRRFELYPKFMGQIGTIDLTYSLAGSPTSENGTPGGGFVTLNVGLQSATASSGFNGSNGGSFSLPIFAGNFVQIRTGANATSFDVTAHGSASVSYKFDLLEERVHYGTDSFDLTADDPAAWFERAAPGARQVAVFTTNINSGNTRLTSDTEWRGLIGDGFHDARINLDGHTLNLVDNDSSVLDRSITVGEERGGHTGLMFNSGAVVASLPVLVENRTAAQANSLGFPGSAALGVANGASLDTPLISVANKPGTRGALSAAGPGSRITAKQITIGREGSADGIVLAGARLEPTQLLEIARGPAGSTAELKIDGIGSILETGGFAFVGGAAKGVLAIVNGASADFGSTKVTIGDGTHTTGSRLTITGPGTIAAGGIFTFGLNSTLEITDHASFTTSGASGIGLSTDSIAKFTDGATVNAGNLLTLDRGAQFQILSGAQVNVDTVHIELNNLLVTGGAATRLNISDSFLVNGDVGVLAGSTVSAGDIAVGDTGRIFADANATLRSVNKPMTVRGALIPDVTQFLPVEPPPGGGGGGGDAATAAAVLLSDNAEPVGSHFTIDGSVHVLPSGSFELDLFGPVPDQVDHISVLGSLTFEGTLRLNFHDFLPIEGQSFSLLDAQSLTGLTPSQVSVSGIAPGWLFDLQFNPANGSLSLLSLSNATVPEPAAMVVFPIAFALLNRRIRTNYR